ncbi:MAG: aspartate--tRNA ligase [Oscillospiraceae bacterium]|nr:aspartate--tRNA ligase [Oscillospiraceae bacterium]
MNTMSQYRTHNCGELRKSDIDKTVRLSGWIDTVRDHGGVIFVDLRDHYGVTQAVFHDDSVVGQLSKESVVLVEGKVRLRDKETVNDKIETGEVELHCERTDVLSRAEHSLPFEIRESEKIREDLRLQYRYLDLRNPAVHENMVLRSNVTGFLRKEMEQLGFLEIQTPILTASSPEGARDYLVPSRKHHGKFYALPQAPQQFKQLLMASGFDKYFQIAPCFRDEDARADRSPGEFYQLDFEMAFAGQEDVLGVCETVLHNTFKAFSDKTVNPAPFPRIPFAECMLKYGTDKPDLRNPLIIQDLTEFFSDADFAPFKNKPVRGITAPGCAKMPKSFFEKMLGFATSIGMKGLGYISVGEGFELKGPIVKFLSPEKQKILTRSMSEHDTVFFISDVPGCIDSLAGQIRTELGEKLNLIDTDSFSICFVVDFPMYEADAETGGYKFTHNPFSMPQGELEALETASPLEIKAWQYDVVCNGIELSSGAVRNHRPDIMRKAFAIAGYDKAVLSEKFPALYTAFQYGAPPHAGMAPGIDRIVMLLAAKENIREVIPFPMNANAQDMLMGAPCEVTELQLREAHIKIR